MRWLSTRAIPIVWAAGWWMNHRVAGIAFLADRIGLGHRLGFGRERLRVDPIGLVRQVLLAGRVPVDRHK